MWDEIHAGPYPEVARYYGSGSIDEAGNFQCVAP
ncbi:tannase/feruloyl esterase family alpha/beta hydrolase [Gammaproteobacteria bacterium]|nr:tannase/feruloyl esterase family alpha/beta hydrolase [Gammaproteobacteria bacterium]